MIVVSAPIPSARASWARHEFVLANELEGHDHHHGHRYNLETRTPELSA